MAANRRPDPEPLETDDVFVITLGTVVWAVAFLVLLTVDLTTGAEVRRWMWVAAAGALLGLIGIRYVRRRRAGRARPAAGEGPTGA